MSVTIYGNKQLTVQVVQTVSTTQQAFYSTSFTELSSLNTTINPINSSNKILVMTSINFGAGNDDFCAWRLYRNGTWLNQSTLTDPASRTTWGDSIPTGSANAYHNMGLTVYRFLDSPGTTGAVTYSIQVSGRRSAAMDFTLNRSFTISDANQMTGTSTLTLMEIAYS